MKKEKNVKKGEKKHAVLTIKEKRALKKQKKEAKREREIWLGIKSKNYRSM